MLVSFVFNILLYFFDLNPEIRKYYLHKFSLLKFTEVSFMMQHMFNFSEDVGYVET